MAGFEPAFPPWRGGNLDQTNPHPHIGIMMPYACIRMKCNSWLRWTDGIRTRSQFPVPEPQSGATNQIRLCPHGWTWTRHDYNAFISSGLKKPEPADCHTFMQCVMFNAYMMTSEWFRRIFKSGWRESNALSPVPKTGGLPIFPHPVIFYQSHHNHVCMSTFAYINPWYEPMAGNAPASILYESTVLLLNYTGIDAHTVKQHRSSIMISCAHMHPCRDDIVSWMEFESMAFWFGIKCSIHWAIRTIKAASRIGLYLQWTRKWKHCLHPTGSYHEFGHQPAD